MWSRRDQIQAYQFVRRRTVSAVLVGDANHAVSPTRRPTVALITGIVVLVLVVVGFALYGVLRPGGSTAWRTDGAIVQERESGARFVLSDDGALHPVPNYASARLLVGDAGRLVRVSRTSLAGVGRGPALGIPGAPDALPPAARLLSDPWTVCSSRAVDAGPGEPAVLGIVVGPPSDTRRVVLGPGAAVVAETGPEVYVITDGRRFRVRSDEPDAVLLGLGLGQAPRVVVDRAWLATVPAGPDLGYLEITRRGEASPALPGVAARVGQVFALRTAGSTGEQFFVLLVDGLAPIATTQARLILADPRTVGVYPEGRVAALDLPPAALAAGQPSATDLDPDQYPATAPEALTFTPGEDVVLCSRSQGFRAGLPAVELTLSFAVPAPSGVRPLTTAVPGGSSAEVYVPVGSGALVRSVSAEGVTAGAVHLVTDEGRRYAVPDAESRAALGLEGVTPTEMPPQFVELLPAGPTLDRAAAGRALTEAGSTGAAGSG
ncbi:MAG: type VII secretion protein EccB [Kineosporiaceae bacterium]